MMTMTMTMMMMMMIMMMATATTTTSVIDHFSRAFVIGSMLGSSVDPVTRLD
jgi:hypothetical protein